jgi:hypothetical protein
MAMKRACTVLLIISLSAFTVAAQAPQQKAPATSYGVAGMEGMGQQKSHIITVLHAERAYLDGCPVSLHAGHLADGSMVQTSDAHPRGLGQWLSLSLISLEQKQIASATLVVHGMTPKPRMSQALTADNGMGDAVRTFHLSFAAGPQKSAVANLWVPGMSAVERIELRSLEYSDGSTWKVAENASCQVAPDPFMLVTKR